MLKVPDPRPWLRAQVLHVLGEYVHSTTDFSHKSDTQGKLVGRYPVVFIILTLVVTGACSSGLAMSVSVLFLNTEFALFNITFVFRDFGTKSDSKEGIDLPKEVKTHILLLYHFKLLMTLTCIVFITTTCLYT